MYSVIIYLLTSMVAIFFMATPARADVKPSLTLDEFFNLVSIDNVQMSPDGNKVMIQTSQADWGANRFRSDLWLYRVGDPAGKLMRLTTSGHVQLSQWSLDSKWIAFCTDKANKSQIFIQSVNGGKPSLLIEEQQSINSLTWSASSDAIFYSATASLDKNEKQQQKAQWHDTIRYPQPELGDTIWRVGVARKQQAHKKEIIKSRNTVTQIAASNNGKRLAFVTESTSDFQETFDGYGIYVVDLADLGTIYSPRLISYAKFVTERIRWALDNRHLFFNYEYGAVNGGYQNAQERLYWVDTGEGKEARPMNSKYTRWAATFEGTVMDYTQLVTGGILATGGLGTEAQLYKQNNPNSDFNKMSSWTGTYAQVSSAATSPRIAFIYSSFEHPMEAYLANSVDDLATAKPITNFNKLFTQRALPQGKTFRWKADDGATIEGLLIYPPGKMNTKNLKMLTLIHGGPYMAATNQFQSPSWYFWEALAATDGWLVFEPNYRGSVGYGDRFALSIVPHSVSRPGKDVLEGVDALVKAGIAKSDQLTIGGFSYGGYLSNWLITQTSRFKAAVAGAGAVEHAMNWGNTKMPFLIGHLLGGPPWEEEANYNTEAAIWQFGKVVTPTHVVAGENDNTVYVGENHLLNRALRSRGIPSTLLIFPNEGHGLVANPWHGKIKVREELKWLDKYGAPR